MRPARPDDLPSGLCPDREEHEPHLRDSPGLGRFWCTADQSVREPARSDRARQAGVAGGVQDGAWLNEATGVPGRYARSAGSSEQLFRDLTRAVHPVPRGMCRPGCACSGGLGYCDRHP